MRQRVGFARALVVHPDVLLMDEPFSALDVLTAEKLRTDILDSGAKASMPIKGVILVTHNIEEAVLMCDRILVLSSNPGRVIAEIKVPLPRPRSRADVELQAIVERIYVEMTAKARAPAAKPGEKPAATAQADRLGANRGAEHAIAAAFDKPDGRASRSARRCSLMTAGPTCRILRMRCCSKPTSCFPSLRRYNCCGLR